MSEPPASTVVPTIEESVAPGELLPHSLYFLGKDPAGLVQVFRIGRDGETRSQVTFEPVDVADYDVSPAAGGVAYVVDNQLLLVNADGSNRRVVVDGGPRENNFWVSRPVFSPDGETLAVGHMGVHLYDVAAGISQHALEEQYSTVTLPNGLPLPLETYEPERYSPDGTRLLIRVGHPTDSPSTAAIYSPASDTLVHLSGGGEGLTCCNFHGGPEWSADSSAFYSVASIYDSTYRSGALWKVDGTTGAVTTLIPGREGEGRFNLPIEPYLAPDGWLYFFFGSYHLDSGYLDAPKVNLLRSAPDGVTDRTVILDENFVLMTEALWAPDARLVIVASAPSRTWNLDGGVLELFNTDRESGPVWLAPLGYQLKWGP